MPKNKVIHLYHVDYAGKWKKGKHYNWYKKYGSKRTLCWQRTGIKTRDKSKVTCKKCLVRIKNLGL